MLTFFLARFYVYFGAATCDKTNSFLGIFPKWYKYLDYGLDSTTQHCEVKVILRGNDGIHLTPLLPIGLAILDMLLRLAGIIAVGYVIYGAFRYIISQGEPENTKNARETIINALIGTAIVIVASAVVAFIGSKIV